jgi:hypothetical protein
VPDHRPSAPRLATAPRLLGSWRAPVFTVLLAASTLAGCGPLPNGEYWKGSFLHIDTPRYTFEVPEGWREAKAEDYPALGFNRSVFARVDAEERKKLLQNAELELQAIDTGLISSQGAWIQVISVAGSGGYGVRGLPQYGLSESEKQALWERFATGRIQRALPGDKPVLTLESIDIPTYGSNRLLRLRFRSDERRGSMHWTILGLYTAVDTILLAHLGTPENRDEGIAGLEAIATSLRLD